MADSHLPQSCPATTAFSIRAVLRAAVVGIVATVVLNAIEAQGVALHGHHETLMVGAVVGVVHWLTELGLFGLFREED